MNKVTKLITLLAVYCAFYNIFAQGDTTGNSGYLVTKNNDTLRGKIYNHHKHAHNYIRIKQVNSKKDTTFYPQHVLFYSTHDKTYTTVMLPDPVDNDTIYQFAQILISGPINLYETKIKTDFILPPKRAYLAEKAVDKRVVPFGKTVYIVPLISDYEELAKDVADYKYDNSLRSKKLVCETYNAWVQKK